MRSYLTSWGIEYLLRALNGEELIFTHVAIGSGDPPDNPKEVTELVHQEKLMNISSKSLTKGYISLICDVSNAGIDIGFRITEYGIFAQDMDDSAQEVLYAYCTEDYVSADYMPAASERPMTLKISPTANISTAENVSAVISGTLEYINREEFDQWTQTHLNTVNPHNVTKEQIGLGNVPNVSTEDQTPDFSSFPEMGVLKNIEPGDNMITLFGKIRRFLIALITHLQSKNPHSINIDTISAAPKNHTHKATDINDGVLPFNRGGTGQKSEDDFKKYIFSSMVSREIAFKKYGYYTGDGVLPRVLKFDCPNFTPRALLLSQGTATSENFLVAVRQTTSQAHVTFDWQNTYVKLTLGNVADINNYYNRANTHYYYMLIG